MEHIVVDVVSDVVCPWCFLGKARLEQAISQVSSEMLVTVNWRPYQLNPDLPAEGVNHKEHLAAKLGGTAAVAQAHERLTELGRQDGIAFDFDAVKISPNTLDAHRLLRWAGNEGRQNEVANALFSAYFEEGRNVGDRSVLHDIATSAGLDSAVIDVLLASDADKQEIGEEISMARDMGVSGVPCFIIDSKYAVMGAQSVDVLANAFREIAAMKNPNQVN